MRSTKAVVDLVPLFIVLAVILVDGIVGGDVGLDGVETGSLAFDVVLFLFEIGGAFWGLFTVGVGVGVIARFFVFGLGFDGGWFDVGVLDGFGGVVLFVIHVGEIVSCVADVQVKCGAMVSA